jgi:hypothetical protein
MMLFTLFLILSIGGLALLLYLGVTFAAGLRCAAG